MAVHTLQKGLRPGGQPGAHEHGDPSHAGEHSAHRATTAVPPRVPLHRTPRRHVPPGATTSRWPIILFILAALAGLSWVTWQEMEEKIISEKFNLSLAALDKAYLGCKVYWKEQGFYKRCSQSIVDKFYDSKDRIVKVTVLKDRQTNFTAIATHSKSDKVFQVDKEGSVFLKVDDCLVKVPFYTLTPKDVASLENKCVDKKSDTTPSPPPMPAF